MPSIPKSLPVTLFLVSFTIISFQLALLRSLSFIRYYHFAYLVIGTALLGFGASGTFLSLLRRTIEKSADLWISWLACLFAAAIPVCYLFAQAVPLDVQYMFVRGQQLLYLVAVVLILAVPFFLGALLIGISLSFYTGRIHFLYGINLLGSGAGGISTLPFMALFPPDRFPVITALPAAASAVLWITFRLRRVKGMSRIGYISAGVCMAALGASLFSLDISIPADQYKALSMFKRLEGQGDARHLLVSYNGRSRLDLFSSPVAHQTLFAGPGSTLLPPEQQVLLDDGDISGILFNINDADDAAVIDSTPQSLPYRLTELPRVLLLGDAGNINLWLGARFHAREIVLVHPDPRVVEVIREKSPADLPVQYIARDPRLYLEQNRETEGFDIIHVAGAEAMPAAAGGLGSLNENYLLTVEGLNAAYSLLTERGFITVTRGVQNPPRDGIRIFRLFALVSRRAGKNPSENLLQGRNYLAVNTLLAKSPLGTEVIADYITECESLSMDPEYYPGIRAEEENYLNMLDGPKSSASSWFRFAAFSVIQGREKEFDRAYLFRTKPPTDDSPYFHHFFTWKSLGEYRRVYKGMMFRSIELGIVILVFSLAAVIVVAFLLIMFPLILKRTDLSGVKNKFRGIAYFPCIGLAFMFLEIVWIQKFGLHLGSPVFSASAVITSILVFAGAGSIAAGRAAGDISNLRLKNPFLLPLFPLLIFILLYLFIPDMLLSSVAGFSKAARFITVIFLLAPPSFFMGWFFPLGVSLYQGNGKPFIPFAWGINGFASVAASPLALLLSIALGFRFVMILAAVLYTAAVLSMYRMPQGAEINRSQSRHVE